MDLKVGGSEEGITGVQMDIKVPNVTTKIMQEAMEQGRKARLFILDKMVATISKPRAEMSQYAPRIYTLTIPTDKIRDLIGPGGKMIRSIVDETGVKIDVEDDGSVKIYASNGESAKLAIQRVTDIAAVAEVGKTYLGKVVRLGGVRQFREIFPG